MENKIYHIVGTFPQSNRKIVERDNIDTPSTQIHDCSLSWLGLVTSITLGGVNLTLSVSEIMGKKSIYANMQMQIYTQGNNIDTIQQ